MCIFKAWPRWSSRHWPPSSSRLKMIAGFMEFLLLLVTRLSLFAAWSFARQWIMKPFRLLIKWSLQLDLTQIPINSLAGELRKRPQILIVSAEFLASIEVVPRIVQARETFQFKCKGSRCPAQRGSGFWWPAPGCVYRRMSGSFQENFTVQKLHHYCRS